MFHFARSIACAALMVGLAPVAALAQSGGDKERMNQPPAQAAPQTQRQPVATPAAAQPGQHQTAAASRTVQRDMNALAAPRDRNWIFRDPRLEP